MVLVLDIGLAVVCLDEGEYLAVDQFSALCFELLPDVGGHFLDVALQEVNIGEDGLLHPLRETWLISHIILQGCHLAVSSVWSSFRGVSLRTVP